jgi:transposase-like protein
MGRRHFKPEQIIHMLREAEIKLAGGKTTGEVCRELGISEQSYYRWRKVYRGMQQTLTISERRALPGAGKAALDAAPHARGAR